MKRSGILLLLFSGIVFLFFHGISYTPPDIDHARVIRSLNKETLKKGKDIYIKSCITCHGSDGTASLPQARSFNKDKLRFGNKPYDMWKTISFGAGMMAPQTWLQPAERYYVIQYIREEFMKKSNPRQYFKISDEYLSKLPRSQKTIAQQLAETKREALKGSLKYGQEWFMRNKSNYGFAIHSQVKDHATAVLSVLLDSNILISYNLLRMGTISAWQGQLNLFDTKYKRYRGEGEPFIQGKELKGLDTWQWTYSDKIDSLDKVTGVRTPLPAEELQYHGHYTNGKNVVLSYSVQGRKVLEFPQAVIKNNNVILSQSLLVGEGNEQSVLIGHLKDSNAVLRNDLFKDGSISSENIFVSRQMEGNTMSGFIAAGVISKNKNLILSAVENHIVLKIASSNSSSIIKVLRISGKTNKELQAFAAYVNQETAAGNYPPIEEMIKGGSAHWTKKVSTSGQTNVSKPHFDPRYFEDEDKTIAKKLVKIPTDFPYTVDNISLPFNNAYNSWIRTTSLGFKKDGSIIITTYMGDVWMGTGIDSSLKNITWQRIATGLYEPMGMKVIDDVIYITNRNGITILRDLNGDNETDFYENFHSDHDVSAFFHAFNFGLETDSEGNFYYVKPGQYTNNRDPGNVIKVSPNGKNWESIATGFRVNNGITITPDQKIFVSDNQGNWTPGNKINYIEKGKYYGYVQNVIEDGWSPDGIILDKSKIENGVISPKIIPVPDTFQPPALWMPQEFDNSPGGGVWSDKSWGPMGDKFIHTSYGTGWIYHFMPHEVDGTMQAAMVAFPFQFDAGIQRAAVNPVDKQVYVTGLTGWDDGVSTTYGVLSRVRYTGGEGHLIKDAEVVNGGVRLTFNFKLDKETSANTKNFDVSQWNYKRTNKYGSAHYSAKNKGVEGQDSIIINKVSVSDAGNAVFIEVPDMTPVHTMRIRFEVKAEDGTKVRDAVYLTINKVPN